MPQAINIPLPAGLKADLVGGPIFVSAMHNTAVCLSVLAASSMASSLRSGGSPATVQTLSLRGRALKSLRERLYPAPKQVDDATVLAAAWIWVVETQLEDPSTLRWHGSSVEKLVASRGGLSRLGLGGSIEQVIRWADGLTAMVLVEEMRFKTLPRPDDLPDPPPRMYGASLEHGSLMGVVDAEILAAGAELCRTAEIVEAGREKGLSFAHYVHAVSSLNHVMIPLTSWHTRYADSGSLNECVAAALQIFSSVTFTLPRLERNLLVLLSSQLRRACEARAPPDWLAHLDLLIWITLVVLNVPHEFADKTWFADLLRWSLNAKFARPDGWPADWRDQTYRILCGIVWCKSLHVGAIEDVCPRVTEQSAEDE